VPAGDVVTVPIWLDRADGVANINFEISYDARIVKAEQVHKGGLVPRGVLYESNPGQAGVVRIGFAGNRDVEGSGPVAQVAFRAIGKPGTRTPLTLKVTTIADAAGGKPAIRVMHGSVQIVPEGGSLAGDGNGNGVLDAGDALQALKMSVQLLPEKKVCDLDADGRVTSTDARLILQKVVGK
jgi:hypothetical protein